MNVEEEITKLVEIVVLVFCVEERKIIYVFYLSVEWGT
jgi:hypothetical protein